MTTPYRQCSRCIMDTTAAGIRFDADGRCNYCTQFEQRLREFQPSSPEERERKLAELVRQVREEGRGRKYDCIVGVSGGADSAYALYETKRLGLRPLAVHMDNGWDSELAANNIENLVRKLDVDLQTTVINWNEYRRLMQAFFDADVIDIELLYDNAMLAVNFRAAAKYGIRWILAGANTATEGMQMPPNWNWFKYDARNIKRLARRSGAKVKSMPTIGIVEYVHFRHIRHIQFLPFLDYLDYLKERCMETLTKELGFRPYPYKHYESIFTRFYQGYILPTKFNVDKRKLHLSTLIVSGQMTREEALKKMEAIPYPSEDDLQSDIEYFLKKMGWTRAELNAYLARPEVPHAKYGTEEPLWKRFNEIKRRLRDVKAGRLTSIDR